MTFKEFLERVAPSVSRIIGDFEAIPYRSANTVTGYIVDLPEIELYCDHCKGSRFFKPRTVLDAKDSYFEGIAHYDCKNCEFDSKQYALRLVLYAEDKAPHKYKKNGVYKRGLGFKFGQGPAFGPIFLRSL